MTRERFPIFTIGHSTHNINVFQELLTRNSINLIIDVRSAPYSRWQPQFNKEGLERTLPMVGIDYLFLGHELGARPDDQSCYKNGRVQYDLLAKTRLFNIGIEHTIQESARHRLAIMCAEKEPLECHRTFLVGRALTQRGISVHHILADGSVEAFDHAMSRLLCLMNMPEATLFETREDLIEMAAKKQEEIIAYHSEEVGAARK